MESDGAAGQISVLRLWIRTDVLLYLQMIMEEQDRTLGSITGTLSTLTEQAGLMGREIGEHME